MGSKTAARQAAIAAGVPVVPGTESPLPDDAPDAVIAPRPRASATRCVVKAVAGGGGKGMRTVASRDRAAAGRSRSRGPRRRRPSATRPCTSSAESSGPRHIEIQLLGDQHGTVIPFVERECSIQRRHQKVVEESPSVAISDATRRAMAECAAKVARSVGYTQRRHHRVPRRRGRAVLFPRDEHAAAGRASGHRDGDGPRPRAVAAAHRARRAADDRARARAHAARATRSSAASTRRIRIAASCRRPGSSAASACPAAPASATIAASRRASRSRCSTTR